ncbi:MAG TPA: hypothetical protein VF989_11975 [Polyangiaceae bacterium]
MTSVDVIRWIGISHLLQPPLTAFLASPRGLDLRRKLKPDSPLGTAVIENMAIASIVLPTALGLLLALHAEAAVRDGPARTLAWLLAAFWCFRLYRQLFVLHQTWPREPPRVAHLRGLLGLIFFVQGPLLAATLIFEATVTGPHQSANRVQPRVVSAR